MDVLEHGVPTVALLVVLGTIASIYTGWKLQFNAVQVIAAFVILGSLAIGGFAIGELSCHRPPSDGAYQGELSKPMLHFSQSTALLLTSIGGIILGIVWAFNEDHAKVCKKGRHAEEFSETLMDRANNDA